MRSIVRFIFVKRSLRNTLQFYYSTTTRIRAGLFKAGLSKPRFSVKSEGVNKKFSVLTFVKNLIMLCSKKKWKRENYSEKASPQRNKETRIKI